MAHTKLILSEQRTFQDKMKKYFFIAVTLLLFGCNGIICKYGDLPDLGNGYKFETLDCETLEIVNSDNTVMIDGIILAYAFDSTFIIASQRPWDVPDVPGIKEMTYNQRNEAFEKSTFRQYWIINKKAKNEYKSYVGSGNDKRAIYSNVYGLFSKEEYLQKREELGVSKKLQLKE